MNIFVSDLSPKESAINLDDKRVVKMVLESAQILSTAMNEKGITKGPYRSTHINHPSCVWASQNSENFRWLTEHFYWLCMEYEYRYNKEHKCFAMYEIFKEVDTEFKLSEKMTPFPNCTTFKDIKEVTLAYRKYLVQKWENDKRFPRWTNRTKPIWVS